MPDQNPYLSVGLEAAGASPAPASPAPSADNPYLSTGLSALPRPSHGALQGMADAKAAKYGLNPALFRAMIGTESSWSPTSTSPKGAQGLGQLMPDTARGLGVTDPNDPDQNLDASARYLRQQLDAFGGDVSKALAAYNAGPGAVHKYGGVPPYKETQAYVKRIMAAAGVPGNPSGGFTPKGAQPGNLVVGAPAASSSKPARVVDVPKRGTPPAAPVPQSAPSPDDQVYKLFGLNPPATTATLRPTGSISLNDHPLEHVLQQATAPVTAPYQPTVFNGVKYSYDPFRSLPFEQQAYQSAVNGGTVVQNRDGKGYTELGAAQHMVQQQTGQNAAALTRSQSDVEQDPERQIAAQAAHRAKDSMIGRYIEAQRSGAPNAARASLIAGMVGSGIDQIYRGAGMIADTATGHLVGHTLDQATDQSGNPLSQDQKGQLLGLYGQLATAATTGAAGTLLSGGLGGAAASKAGAHAAETLGKADLGLMAGQPASVALDPTQDPERRKAALGQVLFLAALPAAGGAARLLKLGSGGISSALDRVLGANSPEEAVRTATESFGLPPGIAKRVVDEAANQIPGVTWRKAPVAEGILGGAAAPEAPAAREVSPTKVGGSLAEGLTEKSAPGLESARTVAAHEATEAAVTVPEGTPHVPKEAPEPQVANPHEPSPVEPVGQEPPGIGGGDQEAQVQAEVARRVLVGEDHYDLTGPAKDAYEQAEAKYRSRLQSILDGATDDPAGKDWAAKQRKAAAMEFSRQKREIVGALTDKETKAAQTQASKLTPGMDAVAVDGSEGKVKSNAFGRVVLEHADGTTSLHERANVRPKAQKSVGPMEGVIRVQAPEPQVSPVAEAPKPETRPVTSDPDVTGARNSIVEAERQARGENPVQRQEYTTPKQAQASGEETVAADPHGHIALSERVANKPRPITAAEHGELLAGRRQLINSFNRAKAAYDAGIEAKDPDLAALKAAYENYRRLLDVNDQALVKSGRETSASLNARKMGVALDTGNFAEVYQEARRAKGADLSKAESDRLQAAVKAYNELLKRNAELEERLARPTSEREFRRQKAEARKTTRQATAKELDDEFAALSRKLLTISGKASAGLDPAAAKVLAQMVANRVQKGALTLAQAIDSVHEATKDKIEGLSKMDVLKAYAKHAEKPVGDEALRKHKEAIDLARAKILAEIARQKKTPAAEALKQGYRAMLVSSLGIPRKVFVGFGIGRIADSLGSLPSTVWDAALSKATGQRASSTDLAAVTAGLRNAKDKASFARLLAILKGHTPDVEEGVSRNLHQVHTNAPPFDAAVNTVFNSHSAMYDPLKQYGYAKSIAEQATLAAKNARDPSLRQKLIDNPTDSMKERAEREAAEGILMNRNRLAEVITKRTGLRETPAGTAADFLATTVAPVPSVASNAAGRLLEHSPLGAVKAVAEGRKAVRLSKAGDAAGAFEAQRESSKAFGRSTAGLMGLYAGYVLAKNRLMTGEYDKDVNAGRTSSKGGHGNLQVPGVGNFGIDESPLGKAMAIGALWAEMENRRAGPKEFWQHFEHLGSLRPFATGPIVDAAETIDGAMKNPEKQGVNYVQGIALAPLTGLGSVAKMTDYGHDRKAKTFGEKVESKIPGLRQRLPEKL